MHNFGFFYYFIYENMLCKYKLLDLIIFNIYRYIDVIIICYIFCKNTVDGYVNRFLFRMKTNDNIIKRNK